MAVQIGRFSFRGPFSNLDEIKNRPGLFILHDDQKKIHPIIIGETSLLKSEIENQIKLNNLQLGENCFVSVYNTYCALQLDREEMTQEICDLYSLNS